MKTRNLDSWEAFEDVVKQGNIKTEQLKKNEQTTSPTSIIYRGQANAEWELKNTLEQKVKKDITVNSYFNVMLKVWDGHARTYKKRWPDLKKEIKECKVNYIYSFRTKNNMQIIRFMAYLRHHGFPSPLLDWTEDQRIAAFFAFANIPYDAERIAIYTFREITGHSQNSRNSQEPTAIEIGNGIPGIERHENQKAHYTLCVQYDYTKDFKNAIFANMEKAINNPGSCNDSKDNEVDLSSAGNVTCKYTIPVSERNKVLKKLQTKGINRCFLFQDETEDSQLFDYWNIILANEGIN